MASKNINLVTSVVCWCWTRPWQFSHQGYFILKIVQVLFAQYICSIIYIIIIRCKLFFLFIGWKPTKWPANNCLQIMVCSCAMLSNYVWLQIIFCSCVNKTIFIKKQTWWSNDKTIIELGYRKILWFASVSHINYLPQPSASKNNWSARHWKITIFCSTSSNNC